MKRFFLILIPLGSVYCTSQQSQHNVQSLDKNQSSKYITITNSIDPKLLKCYGQMPNPFIIQVNDKTLNPGATLSIPVEKDKIHVRYNYSFLKGVYKGENVITFALDPKKTSYDLNFSWEKKYEPWRIILSGATPLEKNGQNPFKKKKTQ